MKRRSEDGLSQAPATGARVRLLTVDEVAEDTRIPAATLRFWRHKGTGPKSFKLGRRVVYRESDVLAWVEAQYASSDRTPAA